MRKKEFPDEGDHIIGTVSKVQNFGAFVKLDEYPGHEGFIHISEVATGWVKRIRNHVREKQKVVCKVLHVDEGKNHVDLSLKRVNEHQRRDRVQEWKNNQKATKLFEMVAAELDRPVDDCYDEFGDALIKKYGSLYGAFEEFAYDVDAVKEDGFSGEWFSAFHKISEENISIPFVEIKGTITLTSNDVNGVEHVRTALALAEESEYEDVPITLTYIGAPRYHLIIQAPDYKIAEDQLKKAIDRATDYIKHHNGDLIFTRDHDE